MLSSGLITFVNGRLMHYPDDEHDKKTKFFYFFANLSTIISKLCYNN